jgi:hypothetical protein
MVMRADKGAMAWQRLYDDRQEFRVPAENRSFSPTPPLPLGDAALTLLHKLDGEAASDARDWRESQPSR